MFFYIWAPVVTLIQFLTDSFDELCDKQVTEKALLISDINPLILPVFDFPINTENVEKGSAGWDEIYIQG